MNCTRCGKPIDDLPFDNNEVTISFCDDCEKSYEIWLKMAKQY